MAEMLTYAPDLRSITGGQGDYTLEFLRYEEVPGHLAQKIVDAGRATSARGARVRASRPAQLRRERRRPLPYGAMTTRSIVTSQPDVACDVCGRRLLRGEQPDVVPAAGAAAHRCASCARRGPPTRAGCASRRSLRSSAPPLRRGRARGLFERLRQAARASRRGERRRVQPAPTAAERGRAVRLPRRPSRRARARRGGGADAGPWRRTARRPPSTTPRRRARPADASCEPRGRRVQRQRPSAPVAGVARSLGAPG